jgi:hypothetical protein
VSDVITLPTEYAYWTETFSDTPIFDALAAATLFTSPIAATDNARRLTSHREAPSLSRSCVMPRSPRGGGRHRRLPLVTEHMPTGGRHHLVAAG